MNYQIRSLGYDPESDELDLIINADEPISAYVVDTGGGILIRRQFKTDAVVGAVIRGYEQFVHDRRNGAFFDWRLADQEDLHDVIQAIFDWQHEIDRLSRDLSEKLGNGRAQYALIETLITSAVAS